MEIIMNIQEKVSQFILNNFLMHESNIDLDINASLLEEGIIDSTGVLELVSFLESEFSVKITEDEIIPENLDTIENIVAFVEKKKNLLNRI